MNPLDWLLALFLLYSTIRAAFRGFFREAFTLAGLLIGFPLACWFYRDLGHQLRNLIPAPAFASFIAFLLILGCGRRSSPCFSATSSAAEPAPSASASSTASAVPLFGLLRGAVIATALLLALTAFLPAAPWVQNSLLAPYFLRAAHAVSFTMPEDLRTHLLEGLDHLKALGTLKHSSPDWIKSGLPSHTGVI